MADLELKGLYTLEIHERIKKYILGKLNQKEIDELWMEFLKTPKLFDYFMIELHLYALIMNKKEIKQNDSTIPMINQASHLSDVRP